MERGMLKTTRKGPLRVKLGIANQDRPIANIRNAPKTDFLFAAQQFRQLGDVHRDPSRLIFGEQ